MMRIRARSTKVLLLAATILVALPAAAAVRAVPSAYATIQDAVNDSMPNDTITVAKGEYYENVVIPAALTDLTITGSVSVPSNVVLDAAPGGVEGIGFLVRASGVQIRGLTVRHATTAFRVLGDDVTLHKVEVRRTTGIGIRVLADDVTIRYSTIRGTESHAIRANGHGGKVESTDIEHCDGNGVQAIGDDWLVRRSTLDTLEDGTGVRIVGDRADVNNNDIGRTERRGILVIGDDAEVYTNTIVNTNRVGLEVEGERADVRYNSLRWASGSAQASLFVEGDDAWVASNDVHGSRTRAAECIEVLGHDATVKSNTAEGCGNDGVRVDGRNMSVTFNVVRDVRDDCFDLQCTDLFECDGGGNIEDNEAYDCAEDDAYDLDFPISSLLVRDNYANGAGEVCYDFLMNEGILEYNHAFNCGADEAQGECYKIIGDENEIVGNLADSCAEDGFDVRGNENEIRGNTAKLCLEDGFDIEIGDGNMLLTNVSQRNLAEGIENGGTNTVAINNSSGPNRRDLNCVIEAGGTFAAGSPSDNNCAAGGEFVDLQEID